MAGRTPLFQSGVTIPGSLVKAVTQGMVADVGGITGDELDKGVNPFAIYDRGAQGLVTHDDPTAGPYHAFSVGHDDTGRAIVEVAALNGATGRGLRFIIDGVIYEISDLTAPIEELNALLLYFRNYQVYNAILLEQAFQECTPGGFASARSALLMFDRIAERHHAAYPTIGDGPAVSRVDMVMSADCGVTRRYRRTIFSSEIDRPVREVSFANMDNGRVGGIIITGEGTYRHWFVYSDEAGTSESLIEDLYNVWNTVEITDQIAQPDFQGFIYGLLLPGEAGPGHYFVGTYSGTGSGRIDVIQTFDNGATWSSAPAKDRTGLPEGYNPVEAGFVVIPDHGLAMFVRILNSPQTSANMHWAFRPLGGEWSEWMDTGIELGSNPIIAYHKNGQIHVVALYRGLPYAGPEDTVLRSALVKWGVPAVSFINGEIALTDVIRQTMAIYPHRANGLIKAFFEGNLELFMIPGGEFGSTSSHSSVGPILISNQPLTAGGPVPRSKLQFIDNPKFEYWGRGTSFVSDGEVAIPTVQRWRFFRGEAAEAYVERVAVPEHIARSLPFRPRYAARLHNTGNPGGGMVLFQRWGGRDAQEVYSRFIASGHWDVVNWGYNGLPPPGWRCHMSVNGFQFGSSVTFPSVFSSNGVWVTQTTFRSLGLPPGEVIYPSVDEVTILAITLGCVNGDFEYDFSLLGVQVGPYSGFAGGLEFIDNDTTERHERYFRYFDGRGGRVVSNGMVVSATRAEFWVSLDFMSTPNLGILTDVGDWRVRTAAGHHVVSDLVLEDATFNHALIVATISGATPGQAAVLVGADVDTALYIDSLL